MALIQQSEIRRFRHIITPVLPRLIQIAIDNPCKGRTMDPAVVEQWLLGWMLALSTHGRCTYPAVSDILLNDIDRQVAWDNGIFKRTPNGQELTLSRNSYYTIIDKVDDRLGWTLDRHPNLTIAERRERRSTLYEIVDTIVDASIFYENKSGLYSVDESGIWAWRRGKFNRTDRRRKRGERNLVDIDRELDMFDETGIESEGHE